MSNSRSELAMDSMAPVYVFISYASEDRPVAAPPL